jgi:hypothetical protein
MYKKLLMAAALAAGPLLAASAAHADVVSIGLQESGVNGGAITTVASSPGSVAYGGPTSIYGTFTVNNVTGSGNPPLTSPQLLNSSSINISSSTAGTLTVYVSETGIVAPAPTGALNFISGLTQNLITAGFSVQEQSFLDAGNTLYGLTTPLSSATFTAIATSTQTTAANAGAGPYSLTAVYTITSNGAGSANSTINVSVPEPGSLTLFGTMLLGLGLFCGLRRKRV